ncbi:MAG: argininosuccinate lyase [Planctomycetota bacterium]|jgi:argininosuccinate lyase
MAKLWAKSYDLDATMEAWTVGSDYLLDLELVEADILGNLAHTAMLARIGVLTAKEHSTAKAALLEILGEYRKGAFKVDRADEDVHTAVEGAVTAKAGDVGKKIHTARSRNDQVTLDTRLYTRDRLLEIQHAVLDTASSLLSFAEEHREVPYPGRTHMQLAMPSSMGLWAGAFAEALLDDLVILEAAYRLNNQNPLGSAASYGVAVPIDREYTTELLGFDKPINNVLYANNSRGKFEQTVIFACSQVMGDLSKLATDTIFFAMPEFAYLKLPDKYCPGSSIMPQKKNPAPLELMRSRCSAVTADLVHVMSISKGLVSGYNRDLQDTKGPLMRSLSVTRDALVVMRLIFDSLEVDREACLKAFRPEIFAADAALRLATDEGIPFRDAYKKVGLDLAALENEDPVENIKLKTHLGAPGNLGIDGVRRQVAALVESLEAEVARVTAVKKALL